MCPGLNCRQDCKAEKCPSSIFCHSWVHHLVSSLLCNMFCSVFWAPFTFFFKGTNLPSGLLASYYWFSILNLLHRHGRRTGFAGLGNMAQGRKVTSYAGACCGMSSYIYLRLWARLALWPCWWGPWIPPLCPERESAPCFMGIWV